MRRRSDPAKISPGRLEVLLREARVRGLCCVQLHLFLQFKLRIVVASLGELKADQFDPVMEALKAYGTELD